MEFLKKLFGGDEPEEEGFFVYVQCDRCGAKVRSRIHKEYDLVRSDDGYEWHKTIVDSKCFQRIPTVARFDQNFNLISADMEGGRFITKEEYEAKEVSQTTDTDEGPA